MRPDCAGAPSRSWPYCRRADRYRGGKFLLQRAKFLPQSTQCAHV